MLTIGCHLSSSKGFLAMGKDAIRIGANTFQFFSRNPRGGSVKPLDEKDIAAYLLLAEEQNLQPILAHAPYTYNPCTSDDGLREFVRRSMIDDLARLECIPGSLYNLHPGSHVKQGAEKGIELTTAILNEVITPEQSTMVLLETMAGKGSEIGRTFEELKSIIEGVKLDSHLGICLDTCHIFDAGYDIVHNLDGVVGEFDRILGLDRLKAIHLNDSMNPFESHKDRHAKIGCGTLGIETFCRIINHPMLRELPFYLETPNDLQGYEEEIALLKSHYKGS